MKKFGFATVMAGGIVGAFIGLGAPAQAVASPAGHSAMTSAVEIISTGVDHRDWLDHFGPNAPAVPADNGVHPSH